MKLIELDALIAEIERLQDSIRATAIDNRISKEQTEAYKLCVKLRSFVEDTLEVKEIDEQSAKTTSGTEMIREERLRQIEAEGYDAMHDRHHTPQVLCRAAVGYVLHEDPSKPVADVAANLWPWNNEFWKPKDHLRNLVRAGALIAAAIDRLQYEQK